MSIAANSVLPIGAGQFGQIFTTRSEPRLAFKVVRYEPRAPTLLAEYTAMRAIHISRSMSNQLFAIPRPLNVYTPVVVELSVNTTLDERSMDIHPRLDEGESPGTHNPQEKETVYPAIFESLRPTKAAYVMQRITSLEILSSGALLRQYAPKYISMDITMCRLYLGKRSEQSKFFNTRNFPIDLEAYNFLRSHEPSLPDAATVAFGMGRMVATVHDTGYDCRDMEFVLAGKDFSGMTEQDEQGVPVDKPATSGPGWGFYTFDGDQLRPLPRSSDETVQLMEDSFFLNDPYFPRPRSGDKLYESFKDGYWEGIGHDEGRQALAGAFFDRIQQRQRRIDER